MAIKTCPVSDEEVRKCFLREAEISAGLQHPNIVTVHDFGEENGRPYLVQELLPGEDLASGSSGRTWEASPPGWTGWRRWPKRCAKPMSGVWCIAT